MIELHEEELKTFMMRSSKGNQLKWNKDNIWYKADYMGYEGLSEYIISQLLSYSNMDSNEYVLYDFEQIKYKHTVFNGAKSRNFLEDGMQLITIARLYQLKYNRDFTEDVWHIKDIEERMRFLVDQVVNITGLVDFGIYLSKMLTVDALFLNEDRHFHNIAVLMNSEGEFDYCPLFDHGAGLLADTTMDYPIGVEVYTLIGEVKAKTICADFNEALDVAEDLYGQNISFSFDKRTVANLIQSVDIYEEDIKYRVETIIYEQMRKYEYLFK